MEANSTHEILSREAWESFQIGHKKSGLMHRFTSFDDDIYTTDVVTAFEMGSRHVVIKHTCRYQIGDQITWLDYEVRNGSETTLAVVKGEEIHYETSKGKNVIVLPENALPSYLYHVIFAKMQLEEGARFEFRQLTDSDPSDQSNVRFKCLGEEEIVLNRRPTAIWIYGQKTGRKRGNTFWLDENHNIIKSDWCGANSVLVSGVEKAFEGLSPALIAHMEKFLA